MVEIDEYSSDKENQSRSGSIPYFDEQLILVLFDAVDKPPGFFPNFQVLGP